MAFTLEHIGFSYPDKPVLQDFSLTVPDSGVTCLFGPSGCGKTTVLRLLLGLEKPQSGRIHGDRLLGVAVFQENRLLPWKTVLENTALTAVSPDRAKEALLNMGLSETEFSQFPHELSGGMRRRVAIARALAAESRWLALDEPFNGIDAQNRDEIATHIRAYAATRPVVMVTHHPEEIELLNANVISL
ncbi:MAG: ATP-binding cassette domain-containing protein [Ruminococcaceae bacterium]|nr:ATP-binding cassette domain-containing protein [Oscillospiraceae bacterium]